MKRRDRDLSRHLSGRYNDVAIIEHAFSGRHFGCRRPLTTRTTSRRAWGRKGRGAVLLTPLGPDVLNVVRFDGREGLSELFEYTIEAVAEKVPLDFDAVIGADCTLVLAGKLAWGGGDDRNRERRPTPPPDRERDSDTLEGGAGALATARRFSGILTNVVWLGVDNDYYLYRLTLRPWLHLLSFTSDCRIFANQPADAIIRQVFSERGFTDFELRVSEPCAEREYCVQYRESDLDFVLRLMEEEGIFFFYEHGDLKHTLVCADSKSAFKPLPAAPTVFYQDRLVSGRSDIGSIREITSVRRFQPGKVALNDYDYAKPTAQMLKDYAHKAPHQRGEMELYDYPGRYTDPAVGEKLARVILEAEQAADKRRQAAGDVVQMTPGGLTRLVNHPMPSENIEYLVVRCTHRFASQAYRSVATPDQGEAYSGAFELQPSDVPFRAVRGARKPRVFGPQTAVVVGASGEEVDVDDKGRILVHFFWDRRDASSRRVRVAQPWAGKGWGSVVIPRIGQEVVVEFLEGDPDQPSSRDACTTPTCPSRTRCPTTRPRAASSRTRRAAAAGSTSSPWTTRRAPRRSSSRPRRTSRRRSSTARSWRSASSSPARVRRASRPSTSATRTWRLRPATRMSNSGLAARPSTWPWIRRPRRG